MLEGGVRRAGTSPRITAQLIDARTERHLWAEKLSGTLDVTLSSDDDRRLAESFGLAGEKERTEE